MPWPGASHAPHDALGVDIIQNCEVVGIRRENGAVVGIDTNRGVIKPGKVALVAAGHSMLARMADVRLPIESHPLQALVSEPLKPIFPTVVMSNAIHAYISQSDKGDLVIGAGIDAYTGLASAAATAPSSTRCRRSSRCSRSSRACA